MISQWRLYSYDVVALHPRTIALSDTTQHPPPPVQYPSYLPEQKISFLKTNRQLIMFRLGERHFLVHFEHIMTCTYFYCSIETWPFQEAEKNIIGCACSVTYARVC